MDLFGYNLVRIFLHSTKMFIYVILILLQIILLITMFWFLIFFEAIEYGLEKYKLQGKYFVTGDFNSRTSDISEILNYDMYIDTDDILLNHICIPTRQSCDVIRSLIEMGGAWLRFANQRPSS